MECIEHDQDCIPTQTGLRGCVLTKTAAWPRALRYTLVYNIELSAMQRSRLEQIDLPQYENTYFRFATAKIARIFIDVIRG